MNCSLLKKKLTEILKTNLNNLQELNQNINFLSHYFRRNGTNRKQ